MNIQRFNISKLQSSQRAQISIELIVILAAVIALVLLIVSRLQSTGTKAADQFDSKVKDVFKELDKI